MLRPLRRGSKTRKSTVSLQKTTTRRSSRRMLGEPLEVRNLLTVGVTAFAPTTVGSGYATSWDVGYQNATASVVMNLAVYESADASGSQLGNLLTTYSFTPGGTSGTASVPAVLQQADLSSNYYLV